ncbi:MAG: PucR family transcriptional regulator ligand-binding domain-containing protein [Clostridiales Family XIII bacterium]|nr:PucR family transcriptional regulator ligand-binding domain-containing protein [Clostridiales Family XIII bacterium]
MTLQELLSEERFAELAVINAGACLDRTITTVESTETPDVSAYIPPHSFLITTGMAFKDDPQALCRLIEDLDRLPCAGLAIKLGRFIPQLAPEVIETADRLSFPLIRIPKHATLGEVYHDLLSRIWNNQSDLLLNALNAQKKISGLILRGSSLKSILNSLTSVIGMPVAVADAFGVLVETGQTCSDRMKTEMSACMEALLAGGGVGVGAGASAESGAGVGAEAAQSGQPQVFPIRGAGMYDHYLIVVEPIDAEREPGLALVMEQVILALELYFHKGLYMFFNHLRSKKEFLPILLGQFEDEAWRPRQILAVGEAYGMRHSAEYQVALIAMRNEGAKRFNPVHFTEQEELFLLIARWIENFLMPEQGDRLLVFPDEENWRYVLLLMGARPGLEEAYVAMHDCLLRLFGIETEISQGNLVSSVSGIPRSYDEALSGLEGTADQDAHPFLKSYHPRNVMELFKLVSEGVITEICQETLKDLAFPSGEMMEDLSKTLYAYINNGGSITKTSEGLFLHRNTVKYRIKKCEEILGRDLNDAEYRFQVQLALALSERLRG